jgi:hypothetical protein
MSLTKAIETMLGKIIFQLFKTMTDKPLLLAVDDEPFNLEILEELLARHPRYISSWDIHVQRLIPLGRLN